MQIDRHEFYEELKLRKAIQEGIRRILEEERQVLFESMEEEKTLRQAIRKLISETAIPDNDPSPARTTGINVLEDLLKKIVPNLEDDYKKLTTSEEQRRSFRVHILKAIEDTLKPIQVTDKGEENAPIQEQELGDEEIDIEIGDEEETPSDVSDSAFIDIDPEQPVADEPPDEREAFGIEGQNETGRNIAFESFKKISKTIVDSYDVLSDDADQKIFYDYLLKNLDLYFDKFENDMSPSVEAPPVLGDQDVQMTDQGGEPEVPGV